jgi:hypothetical protein
MRVAKVDGPCLPRLQPLEFRHLSVLSTERLALFISLILWVLPRLVRITPPFAFSEASIPVFVQGA